MRALRLPPLVAAIALLVCSSARAQSAETGADTCAAATAEVGELPYLVFDTTAGSIDDYWHDDTHSPPQCDGSPTCASGAGTVFDGTGKGPDRAYRIVTDATCTLTVSLHPTDVDSETTDADDLALFVFRPTCSDNLNDCLCVSDNGCPDPFQCAANNEAVTFQAIGGTAYFVVIDGYTPFGVDPDPPDLPTQGPYELSIAVTAGSCQLCPGGPGACPLFADGFDLSGACPWSASTPDLCP